MNSVFSLNCHGKLHFFEKPAVMGIINITPDSFYAGSRRQGRDAVFGAIEKMQHDGARMIDLGAQSTRPGADWLNAGEEWSRLEEILPELIKSFPDLIFSLDTFHAEVAGKALDQGIHIINDISGGQFDEKMLETVGRFRAPYICMHTRGKPDEMTKMNVYDDLMADLIDYFSMRIAAAQKAGIADIIIDPGFGFAKNIRQNFQLLNNLQVFKIFDHPLLVGISRKSLIYKTLQIEASQAMNGTTVLNTIALQNGAAILRVHDVREAVETVELMDAMNSSALPG